MQYTSLSIIQQIQTTRNIDLMPAITMTSCASVIRHNQYGALCARQTVTEPILRQVHVACMF